MNRKQTNIQIKDPMLIIKLNVQVIHVMKDFSFNAL